MRFHKRRSGPRNHHRSQAAQYRPNSIREESFGASRSDYHHHLHDDTNHETGDYKDHLAHSELSHDSSGSGGYHPVRHYLRDCHSPTHHHSKGSPQRTPQRHAHAHAHAHSPSPKQQKEEGGMAQTDVGDRGTCE